MLDVSFWGATAICAFFTVLFVGSLYLWKQKKHENRDHPNTIKKRFVSVGVVCTVATLTLYFFWKPSITADESFWIVLGLQKHSILLALILPLLLTCLLFLGPLVLLYLEPQLREPLFSNHLIWWRNFIVGPFSEEWVFRACMCSVLISGGYSVGSTILCTPMFFGIAHLHHVIQHLNKRGTELKDAWLDVLFQLFYTTLFGSYSCFLFLRTGHLISPFAVHWFCNYMGFPRIDLILNHPQRKVLWLALFGGALLFFALLFPMTDPTLFDSMYWRN